MVYTVEFVRTRPNAVLPCKSSDGAAGYDLFAVEDGVIWPMEPKLVSTGLKICLPPGTEGQVRSRSGLALKKSVIVLNAPGTIDEDYRGELGVILINFGENAFVYKAQERIAQLVIKPVLTNVSLQLVEKFSDPVTNRGEGGYGSTGR